MVDENKPHARPRGIGTRRHPLLRDRPRGVWYPDLVGVIKSYPQTQEAFDKLQARGRDQVSRLRAEGKWFRGGVPDGFARCKPEWQAILKETAAEAALIVGKMEQVGIVDPAAPGTDAEAARAALTFAVSVVRNPRAAERDRMAASRLVLEFTKQRPVAKSTITVRTAEDFLAALAGELPNG